jgi:L-asparagine oxygenase
MGSFLSRLRTDGFADLGQIDADVSASEFVTRLAGAIGAVPIAEPERLGTSLAGSKPLNTYGGNYGQSELPLHTDLAHWYRPPRYVLLRCVAGSPEVATRLLHFRSLERVMSRTLMRRAMFSPRRRLDGRMYLLRLVTSELFRWDALFLKPQNLAGREFAEFMGSSALTLSTTDIFLAEPGRALLIDNWQVLHGRSAVPTTAANRKLDRTYLDTQ